jgi:RNA polymerase sigma-70 factor (ECF subfamily)
MSAGARSKPTDSELIDRAQRGEVGAYGLLYRRYIDLIFRYVHARVENTRDAEDITETVFLHAFKALKRYKDTGLPYSSFLYQVARNQLVDFYRRQKEELPLEAAERRLTSVQSLDSHVIMTERLGAIRSALEKLPEDYQEVIRLRLLLELPTSTTAVWMKRSEGAVRVLLYRALKALRKQLGNTDEEE